jgi:hypothetical protein
MAWYRAANLEFCLACPISELAPFAVRGARSEFRSRLPLLDVAEPPRCVTGWVGGVERELEIRFAPPGILLGVAGGSSLFIAPGGRIARVGIGKHLDQDGSTTPPPWTDVDRGLLLGPALVLALALEETWCLHSSAVAFGRQVIMFLGDSGQGKSTLAAYLAATDGASWRLAADDILPITADAAGVRAWPRFPQLKLPPEEQPGPTLPEQIPVSVICSLESAPEDAEPDAHRLSDTQAATTVVRHTAGTRLFDGALLTKHLGFCVQVARQVPVYRLKVPRCVDALADVRRSLERLC